MRKFALLAVAAILSVAAVLPGSAEAGCYRLGETGYHWYRSCWGPHWTTIASADAAIVGITEVGQPRKLAGNSSLVARLSHP